MAELTGEFTMYACKDADPIRRYVHYEKAEPARKLHPLLFFKAWVPGLRSGSAEEVHLLDNKGALLRTQDPGPGRITDKGLEVEFEIPKSEFRPERGEVYGLKLTIALETAVGQSGFGSATTKGENVVLKQRWPDGELHGGFEVIFSP